MSILDEKIRKQLEWHLFHYFDYRRDVSDYRERIIHSSTPMFDNVGGGHSHTSDPTALKAIQLLKPSIVEKQKWVQVIQKTQKKFEGTEKGKLLQMKYFDELARLHICKILHIERRTYYSWLDDILYYMAMLAQKYGLIDIEKVV